MKVYKHILEKCPYPCFYFNYNGKIEYQNKQGQDFLEDWNGGCKELTEKNLKILLFQNNLNLKNVEIFANEKYYKFEVVKIEENNYCFYGSNVTFQKNTANTLFNLIDDIHEAMFLIDIDHQGHFIEVNNAATRQLGYTREEMLTMQIKDIIVDFPLISQEEWNDHVYTVKRKSGKLTNEVSFKRKDGTTFPVEMITSLKNVMGKDYQFTLARDITDRLEEQQAREDLKINMFASAKLSHLGEMATNIAHEINNPLTIIIAKILSLKKHLEGGALEKEKSISDLTKVEETVKRITKVIASLRNISKSLETESSHYEIIEDIVRDVLTLYIERIKVLKVDFTIENEEDLIGLEVYCNRSQIAQVIISILNNVFEVLSKLDKRWLKVGAKYDAKNEMLEIRITDSGNTIPAVIVDQMFEPFYSTKELGKGTGLGLPISRSIIVKHGGSLLYDKSSQNTSFVITLPARKIVR